MYNLSHLLNKLVPRALQKGRYLTCPSLQMYSTTLYHGPFRRGAPRCTTGHRVWAETGVGGAGAQAEEREKQSATAELNYKVTKSGHTHTRGDGCAWWDFSFYYGGECLDGDHFREEECRLLASMVTMSWQPTEAKVDEVRYTSVTLVTMSWQPSEAKVDEVCYTCHTSNLGVTPGVRVTLSATTALMLAWVHDRRTSWHTSVRVCLRSIPLLYRRATPPDAARPPIGVPPYCLVCGRAQRVARSLPSSSLHPAFATYTHFVSNHPGFHTLISSQTTGLMSRELLGVFQRLIAFVCSNGFPAHVNVLPTPWVPSPTASRAPCVSRVCLSVALGRPAFSRDSLKEGGGCSPRWFAMPEKSVV
eukprot:1178733-Prorocentrum_minimum.AAC.1